MPDPLSPIINTDVAEMFYWAGQCDEAIAQCQRTLEMNPHYYMAHFVSGWAHVQAGRFAQAASEFQNAQAVVDDPWVSVGLGYVAARAGNTAAARQALTHLTELSQHRYVSPHLFAVMHVVLGENDEALERLEEAYDSRVVQLNWLKIDPRFRALQFDPRFVHLLRRLGLA